MRILLGTAVVLKALTGGIASAEDPGAAIREVISEQIAAFQAHDVAAAFAFASPDVKRTFVDPGRFARMVRNDYPMVWEPRGFRFSGLSDRGGRPVQGVLVTDKAGALHVLDFEMVPSDGGWLVNAVRHRRGDDDAGA